MSDSVDLAQIGSILLPGGTEAAKIVVDPARLIDLLSGATSAAVAPPDVAPDPTTPMSPKTPLHFKAHGFLGDPFGRLFTADMVSFTGGIYQGAGNPFIIQNAAQDCPIPTPPGVKSVSLYFIAAGGPVDGIQGYWSTSLKWHGNRNGKAYDSETSLYTGVPTAAAVLVKFAVSATAGEIHVASTIAGTRVYCGFMG